MDAIVKLFTDLGSIGHIVLMLSLVAATGLALGSLKIRQIGLGIAGVLFTGLIVGHFIGQYVEAETGRLEKTIADAQAKPDVAAAAKASLARMQAGVSTTKHVLHFTREFGLILFVYTIGLQVGPGFLASLRKQGLALNLMAASIVILGAVTAIVIKETAGVGVPVAVGMFSGATTNTPSLGAAGEALKDQNYPEDEQKLQPLAYAVAYPFGIIGIIIAMLLIKSLGRVNMQREQEQVVAQQGRQAELTTINLKVTNPNLNGLAIAQIPGLSEAGVTISRVLHDNVPQVARPDTVVHVGDVVLAVGAPEKLSSVRVIIGVEADVDVRSVPGDITARRLIVTQNKALGKTVEQLDLRRRFGVSVTRVHRSEVQISPHNTPLQFGDNLTVVGLASGIAEAAKEVGDSTRQLNHPQVIPVFVGIVLGVMLGSWAINLGLPAPVKLGLAGGPLLVAIILSRLGHFGPLVWYMPMSANFMLREVGIVLFLASVGLMAGDTFLATLQGDGLLWVGLAAIITLLPLMVVGLVARWLMKTNFFTLCGVLSGSMTDPPALAFAGAITRSDAPSVAYAAVYPLTMLLRVLCAQVIVLVYAG